jgi:hypothetical protein
MADTPFGLSFGNPNRYMGQGPLAEIGKAAKTGLMLYGLQQTGAIEALDKLGVKPNASGSFSYSNPAGPVAPPTSAGAQPVSPVVPSGAVSYPVAEPPPFSGSVSSPPAQPQNYGADILDGKYKGVDTSFVDPQAQRDSLIFPQQVGYNQMLQTGNEYQNVPGYGKTANMAKMMFGMG